MTRTVRQALNLLPGLADAITRSAPPALRALANQYDASMTTGGGYNEGRAKNHISDPTLSSMLRADGSWAKHQAITNDINRAVDLLEHILRNTNDAVPRYTDDEKRKMICKANANDPGYLDWVDATCDKIATRDGLCHNCYMRRRRWVEARAHAVTG